MNVPTGERTDFQHANSNDNKGFSMTAASTFSVDNIVDLYNNVTVLYSDSSTSNILF